jgi:hypothetical protein
LSDELFGLVPAVNPDSKRRGRRLPSVPVQPLLLASQQEYGMFEHFRHYPWVLEPFLYAGQEQLLVSLDSNVIGPAEAKSRKS